MELQTEHRLMFREPLPEYKFTYTSAIFYLMNKQVNKIQFTIFKLQYVLITQLYLKKIKPLIKRTFCQSQRNSNLWF